MFKVIFNLKCFLRNSPMNQYDTADVIPCIGFHTLGISLSDELKSVCYILKQHGNCYG